MLSQRFKIKDGVFFKKKCYIMLFFRLLPFFLEIYYKRKDGGDYF